MSFYTRSPIDKLFYDPFFTSFWEPSTRGGKARDTSETIRAFSPNFDVYETPKEYILEGEVPGLEDKNNVSIEWTDNNTLVIRGKVERTYQAGNLREEGKKEGEGEKKEEGQKEEEKGKQLEKKGPQEVAKRGPEVKYWVTERTVGTFQRSFTFPGDVDQDNVKATLQNGILRIVVPKKEKKGTKKIPIE